MKFTLPGLLMLALSAGALANPLSVHVLNTQTGLPSAGVNIVLEKQTDQGWQVLSRATTNQQGRVPALYPKGQTMAPGTYKVIFETGDWFKAHHQPSFFPQIPVIFAVDGSLEHYHIPLLLSAYGYSTYRGN
ncbi:hydroxyisourate hydrolase [Gallaecimonas pentaromativorans]|uniref:5-hydroxyisourate hydrolase n=1 Tax=Gallaecimonas pentaromativorans TaxID=584787 RepID=A0A3N1PB15_9GAMM|nr:hydroxyisourate hydrolase [Gallaecimonas pentaromativorans]ROQ28582.1 5-hydroxyisourate hydrolase [Gallaecimonas pentaromativorans]